MTTKKTGRGLVLGGTPRVNLLPPQELEHRARRLLWRRYLRVFVLVLVSIGLEVAVASVLTNLGNAEQAAAVQASADLQSKLAKYSMVIEAQSRVQSLSILREQAGSNDQDWSPLVAEIKAVLPSGVGLIGFKLAPGEAPKPGADASALVGLKGTLTFAAKATSAQAETITQLRKVSTFHDVDAGELSSDGPAGGFTFVTTFSADQTRYTGRFVQTGSK